MATQKQVLEAILANISGLSDRLDTLETTRTVDSIPAPRFERTDKRAKRPTTRLHNLSNLAKVAKPAKASKAKARKVEVQNMISAISRAMENFKIDYRQYPWEPPPTSPEFPDPADAIKELAPNDARLTNSSSGYDVVYNVRKKDYLPEIPDKHLNLTQKNWKIG